MGGTVSVPVGACRAGQVPRVVDTAELAGRVHRQQADADVHRRDAEPGRRDRADRRTARHAPPMPPPITAKSSIRYDLFLYAL